MTKSMKAGIWSALLALGASAGLVACGGGGGGGTAVPVVAQTGTLRVALTDAPRCRVANEDLDKVYVTVERVRVHQSADDNPATGSWYEIEIVNPQTQRPEPRKINLLDLTNGRLEELGTTPIPAGTYSQVRLVLSPNRSDPPANSLVRAGGSIEIPLRTPSAAQSGLKIVHPFTVQPNTVVDLVIDFDACRSIVALGNGGYLLKPILTASLRLVAAIVGVVDPLVSNVMVSAQKDGRVVRSTIPDGNGNFMLAYLDPAQTPYDVVITSTARGTSVVPSVPVNVNAITRLSVAATPIPLPTAANPASRTVSGTLLPIEARDDGVFRALQAVGSVPKAEIATTNVNATDGTYTLTLPTAVPLLATYSATLPLTFAAASSPAPVYTIEATATGYVTVTNNIGASATDVIWNLALVAGP
jgi:hypothetical protein